jgi:hypothetical protein
MVVLSFLSEQKLKEVRSGYKTINTSTHGFVDSVSSHDGRKKAKVPKDKAAVSRRIKDSDAPG